MLTAAPAMALTLGDITKMFGASPVVARMGSTELTVKQINELIRAQPAEARQTLMANPEGLKELIRAELMRRTLLEETKKAEWAKRPEVALAMDRAKEQASIDSFLTVRAEPEAPYPSPKDVQAAYEANIAQFQMPEHVRLAQILIRVADTASPEENNRAANLARELSLKIEKGADFGAMASVHSQDEGSKENKGELGWLAEASLSPQIGGEVKGLAAGAVGKPLRTPFGWQILKVLERKPGAARPLAEVRDPIVKALRTLRANENRSRYLDALKKENPQTIDDSVLKTIDGR